MGLVFMPDLYGRFDVFHVDCLDASKFRCDQRGSGTVFSAVSPSVFDDIEK